MTVLTAEQTDELGSLIDAIPELPMSAVTRELVEKIGLKLTAVVGNASHTRNVRQWESGKVQPERGGVLRETLKVVRIIEFYHDAGVATAWLAGTNRHFGFKAPSLVLRERGEEAASEVLQAAYSFVLR